MWMYVDVDIEVVYMMMMEEGRRVVCEQKGFQVDDDGDDLKALSY